MSHIPNRYAYRITRQRHKRSLQRIQYQRILSVSSSNDTDSINDEVDDNGYPSLDDEQKTMLNECEKEKHAEDHYLPDENDNVDIVSDNIFQSDDTPPLYPQSTVTTAEAVRKLMIFCIKSNFDKLKVITMMRLIKTILPAPNKLPTTFKQILKIFGKTPSFIAKFYCNSCLTLTTKRHGQHYCTNLACTLSNSQLSRR